MHAGPETTLTILQEKIWVMQGRRDVKRVIRKCLVCQRHRAQPCDQKMAPLPLERVQFHMYSFMWGQIFVNRCMQQPRPTRQKFIFVFLRAHHQECFIWSLQTTCRLTSFFKPFSISWIAEVWVTLFGQIMPKALKLREIKKIICLKPVEEKKVWRKIVKDKVKSELASKVIKRKYIADGSPWTGGWWVRFCRSVKEPLRKVLGKALLTYTELYTVLTEVKAIINDRPLTFVGNDIRDQDPITQAHLAISRSLQSLPTPADISDDDAGLLKCYLYRQRLVSHFWRRWQDEYLQQLSILPKWNQEQPPVKAGDIVLVSEDKTPRGKWPLACIIETYPGKDNLIHTILLQTAKGELKRPI